MGEIQEILPKCPYIRACPYKYGRLSHTANLVLEKIDKNLDWPPLVGTESQVFPKIYFEDSPYTINMLNIL